MALTGRGSGRFQVILLMLWTLSRYSASSQVRQEFQVLEEQPVGTYVGTIDTKPSFTYRFSENHKLFAINGTTGVISTSTVIDREILQSDVINVVVLPSQPTYPTEVRIVVLDINDNSPVFPDASIVVSFKEDASSGRATSRGDSAWILQSILVERGHSCTLFPLEAWTGKSLPSTSF